MTIGDNYMFATGEVAAPRLRLLEKIYGPTTRMFLCEAGLKPGLQVAEIGCGIGYTACQMATTVGPTGRVVAIDISRDQLSLAKANARQAGVANIEFVEAGATDTTLPTGSMDLVYCRMLLSHIRQSVEALAEFKRILKPDGLLACEDLVASSPFSDPGSPIYRQLGPMTKAFSDKQGVDYNIGLRLGQLIRSAGFDVQIVRSVQPACFAGDEKRWWEYGIREAGPTFLRSGMVSPEQLNGMFRELEKVALDANTLIAQPVMTQVLARNHNRAVGTE